MKAADSESRFGVFDFELDAETELRALELHQDALIIDMCLQGPCGRRYYSAELEQQLQRAWVSARDPWRAFTEAWLLPSRQAVTGESSELRDCWDASGVTGGNREVILDDVDAPLEAALSWTANAIAEFDHLSWLVKALTASDFERAKASGRRAGYMSCQFSSGLRGPAYLRYAHDIGLRMVQLTYNRSNHLGSGCMEARDEGLTEVGRAFVAKMNQLGLIIDTAHCGPHTTLQAAEVSEVPIVASHTSAEVLHPVARAKTDAECEAIASNGGVIGVYAVPFFLSSEKDADINVMLDHIDYLVRQIGVKHVGIGTDWPLQLSSWTLENVMTPWVNEIGFRPEDGINPLQTLDGFDDFRDFPNITRGLVSRGYDDGDVQAILGGNFLRVFREVCG